MWRWQQSGTYLWPTAVSDGHVNLRVSCSLEAAVHNQRRRTHDRKRQAHHDVQCNAQLHSEILPAHRGEQHSTVGAQQNKYQRAHGVLQYLAILWPRRYAVGRSIDEHGSAAASSSITVTSFGAGSLGASANGAGGHDFVARARLMGDSVLICLRPTLRAHWCVRESAVVVRGTMDGSDGRLRGRSRAASVKRVYDYEEFW